MPSDPPSAESVARSVPPSEVENEATFIGPVEVDSPMSLLEEAETDLASYPPLSMHLRSALKRKEMVTHDQEDTDTYGINTEQPSKKKKAARQKNEEGKKEE